MPQMASLPDVKDDVAFITGAASGIGNMLMRELISRGARVILADVQESACQQIVSELNSKAGKTIAVAKKVDITSWDDLLSAYEFGREAFGRVDYFFANAGVGELQWLPKFDDEGSTPIQKPNIQTAEIDYTGQLYTAGLALQVFQRQPLNRHGFRGKLVLTASIYGFYHSVTMPMYCSAKAGVVAFMRSTSELYKDKGVTINCICPNITPTNIVPSDRFQVFEDHGVLTPTEFIVEQFISLLGANQTNGKAIGVYKNETWEHPFDTHKRAENYEAFKLIDDGYGRLFGY
ncbi:hypothetical protein V5O48_014205, partial [Marasmius crinis-equi]